MSKLTSRISVRSLRLLPHGTLSGSASLDTYFTAQMQHSGNAQRQRSFPSPATRPPFNGRRASLLTCADWLRALYRDMQTEAAHVINCILSIGHA